MKHILFFAIAIFATQTIFAQAYDGQADYNKKTQPAIIGEFRYPEETVNKTLKEKLSQMGLRTKSNKGYLVAYNSVIPSINSSPMDYAFKVDRKSRKEKEVTAVTLVININDANAVAINNVAAKAFLAELAPAVDAVNTDNIINDQFGELGKAQKKLKNLQDDQSNMEKKIRNLQDDLQKNAKDQENQQKEIIKQQEILDAFKAKKIG